VREGGEEEACLAEDFGATGMSRDVLQERVVFSVQRSSGTEPLVCVCMRVCVCVRACVRACMGVSESGRERVCVCVCTCVYGVLISGAASLCPSASVPLTQIHIYCGIIARARSRPLKREAHTHTHTHTHTQWNADNALPSNPNAASSLPPPSHLPFKPRTQLPKSRPWPLTASRVSLEEEEEAKQRGERENRGRAHVVVV